MRVLHLFHTYLPSTLSWVAQLLENLPDVQVEVAAPWVVRGQFYQPQRHRYWQFPPQRWLFPMPADEFQSPLAQRLLVGSQRYWPTYRAWLAQQLWHDPPDVLHAHFGPTGCHYLPLAQRLGRPLVVTFYGFDYTKLPRQRPVFHEKYRQLFREAACVVAASEEGCALLQTMGCPAEKLAIVRPSPRLEQFPMAQRDKPAGQLRLVQVASFTPKKGHLTALEAFRLALSDCPGLHLTLAGERLHPATVQQVRQFIEAQGLQPHVAVCDFLEHRRMAEFLTGFDAFIHPSCQAPDGDHEATPVVLLEAQATGLPVLATRHFDLHREVLHDRTGLLAEERDATALAAHIRRLYWMENAEYQQFSLNTRRHVEQNFDVKNSASRLAALYRALTYR